MRILPRGHYNLFPVFHIIPTCLEHRGATWQIAANCFNRPLPSTNLKDQQQQSQRPPQMKRISLSLGRLTPGRIQGSLISSVVWFIFNFKLKLPCLSCKNLNHHLVSTEKNRKLFLCCHLGTMWSSAIQIWCPVVINLPAFFLIVSN